MVDISSLTNQHPTLSGNKSALHFTLYTTPVCNSVFNDTGKDCRIYHLRTINNIARRAGYIVYSFRRFFIFLFLLAGR